MLYWILYNTSEYFSKDIVSFMVSMPCGIKYAFYYSKFHRDDFDLTIRHREE